MKVAIENFNKMYREIENECNQTRGSIAEQSHQHRQTSITICKYIKRFMVTWRIDDHVVRFHKKDFQHKYYSIATVLPRSILNPGHKVYYFHALIEDGHKQM